MLYSVARLAIVVLGASSVSGFHAPPSSNLVRPPAARSLLTIAAVAPAAEVEVAEAAATGEDCGCASDAPGISMNGVSVTGDSLRSTVLADVAGNRVPVSNMVGDEGKAVIVFLRHLGWPLCWDYALNWQSQAARLSAAGVAGPLFISVGQPEQLAKFIELNPELAGASALIDDSPTFEGYRAAGFNYLMGDKALETAPDFKPPKSLSMGKWFSYLKNVIALSPVPKGEAMKLGDVPPGVKVLGGTYAIDGDAVAFAHMDDVPGATPEIETVLKAVGA